MNAGQSIAALVVAAAAALATTSPADARPANCRIGTLDGKYEGACRFTASKGGSFTLEPAATGRALIGSITMVEVTMIRPGVAEVSGLTTEGINSRWGRARRSPRDAACWIGSDFHICAY